jgi:hypothetical protein
MNDSFDSPCEPASVEEMVCASLCNVRQGMRRRFESCENRIRQSPTASVVGAVAAGYFLHRMPVRAILVTQVRIITALTPPALLLFGAAKIYDYLQKQNLDHKP